jgi:sugar (pentulose or hexulose) kinase
MPYSSKDFEEEIPMHKHDDCIAVFDVGKTNKKLLIYDRDLRILDSNYIQLEAEKRGAESHERFTETGEWLLNNLSEMAKRHIIKAVSISAHGATFVCLDEEGKSVLPVFSYDMDPGNALHEKFAAEFGDPLVLQRKNATPDMPGLGCMAKGLFYIKEQYPEEYARTKYILNLPQYYGYLLTGKMGMELTYIGSHTNLWEFEKSTWSGVMEKLGVRDKFPGEIRNPWDILGIISPEVARRTSLPDDTIVTVGIHDSNAALLPYIITVREPFMLLSTGTVCVAMHPTADTAFRDDELGKVIYYNLSAFGTPVKTSIFLAGLEFDVYMGMLKERHIQKKFPPFDRALVEDILARRSEFILPSIVPFGMFPDSKARIIEGENVYPFGDVATGKIPGFFDNFERSYVILTLSIALQTRVALERTGLKKGMSVFIEGGFSHNEFFTNLIASLCPTAQCFITDLNEASGFGAALLALSAMEGTNPKLLRDRFTIKTIRLEPPSFTGLSEYEKDFVRYL